TQRIAHEVELLERRLFSARVIALVLNVVKQIELFSFGLCPAYRFVYFSHSTSPFNQVDLLVSQNLKDLRCVEYQRQDRHRERANCEIPKTAHEKLSPDDRALVGCERFRNQCDNRHAQEIIDIAFVANLCELSSLNASCASRPNA